MAYRVHETSVTNLQATLSALKGNLVDVKELVGKVVVIEDIPEPKHSEASPINSRQLLGSTVISIDAEKLCKADLHYNCSLISWGDKLLLAHRFEDIYQPAKIGIATLDKTTYQPISNIELGLPTPAEDPRLFEGPEHHLYLSYGNRQWINVAQLNARTLQPLWHRPCIHQTNKTEKNWVFFVHENKTYCIYEHSPWTIIEWDENFSHKKTTKLVDVTPKWRYGPIRGGTAPVLISDRYITFFHSCYDYCSRKVFGHKIYVAGWLTFEAKFPFKPIEMSAEPILFPDFTNVGKGPTECAVVFPSGAIKTKDKWIISAGDNDIACQLHFLNEDEMFHNKKFLTEDQYE